MAATAIRDSVESILLTAVRTWRLEIPEEEIKAAVRLFERG
jgi:hypothetical protein